MRVFHGSHPWGNELENKRKMVKLMIRYFVRLAMCMAVLAITTGSVQALDKEYYAPESKLANGKWVKISVEESGIYHITTDDIRSWGLGTDLSQIHIFGYGGAPLSETMLGDNYVDDLPQVPIVRAGEHILFYAQGPTTWKYLNDNLQQLQVQHPYSQTGCYLVTNDARFNDIDITKAQNAPTGPLKNTYIERIYHEEEYVNPGETGRTFLGESFVTNRSQTFKFDLNGLVNGSTVKVYPVFAAQTTGASSSVAYSYNNAECPQVGADNMAVTLNLAHNHYELAQSIKKFTLDGTDKLDFKVDFTCRGTVHEARLDFITVNYERQLSLKNGSLAFGLNYAGSDTTYQLTGGDATTRVWDVTRPFAPVQMNVKMTDGIATFSPAESGRREFIAFVESSNSYSSPKYEGEVANQNIHAQATPDMIIISPSAYLEQAQRVADLHEQHDGFRVLVLDHEKVYNEFSSGTHDAMAYRRLCKMFYDRGKSEDGHWLQYLLLFGGGNYDNRLIGANSNLLDYPKLLTWQSESSANEDGSITTDDYFAVLGDGTSCSPSDRLSIAPGRMIVKSVEEARTAVNKLEKYITKPSYGSWKNQIMFVADDENNGDHMKDSKSMIAAVRANGGENMIYNYVFIDAFTNVSNGGPRNYPDARNKMYTSLNEGVLWWNYVGHASTQNWTGEGLLMRSDVENLLYYKHLPVLFAATCEFTRFDNATLSSGERMFLNPNGGAIAVICPARVAYIYENGFFSKAVGSHIFEGDATGRPSRIGDIIQKAKNDISTSHNNNRRYFVFGDPAMRLAYAPLQARIETINGEPVGQEGHEPFTFKGRESVEFGGKIIGLDGEVATNFDGAIISTLFGPEQSVTTHGYGKEGAKITYEDRPNRLAITVDTVIGGEFTVRVIIPSEVNNEYDNYRHALINLYAYDSRDTLEAMGSNSDFYIYGYEDEEVADTIGPDIITMGLNNDYFVDGSDINESPLLLATIADESGVNFSQAGIGHSMTLTLDGTTSYNDLVSYYTPMYAEEGTLGSISYQLSELPAGMHTLRLRVWDVYNNVNEKTITFNVIQGLAPEIADIYSLFDGTAGETSFYVKHNRPDAVVSVTIEVYDLMGRPVWRTTQSGRSDMFTSTPVTWDLLDSGGRRVPRGIYVYRATITTDGVQVATKSKKLAVPAS